MTTITNNNNTSWNQMIDSTSGGNGLTEFRLSIEGFDYDFVTSQEMANLSNMPKRINGLDRKGITINEYLSLPEPILQTNTSNISFVDYQEQVTKALYRKPTWTGFLFSDISPTDTKLLVSDIGGLAIGDYIWIGSEAMKILALYSDNNNMLIVQRGALNSNAQAHYTLNDLGMPIRPVIQNVPFTIERRRAYLYVYGNGDDLSGNGTLIWRGIVLTQPRLASATKYTMEIGPITELLKTEVGLDTQNITLRGINLGAYLWVINMEFLSSPDLKIGTVTSSSVITAGGFYESIYDLASDLNQQAQIATSNSTVKCGVQVSTTNELLFTQYTTNTNSVCRWTTVTPPARFGTAGMSPMFDFEQDGYAYKLINNKVAESEKVRSITANQIYVSRLMEKRFPSQLSIYSNQPPLAQAGSYMNANPAFGKRLYLTTDTVNTFLANMIIFNPERTWQVATSNYESFAEADFIVNNSQRYIETNLIFREKLYETLGFWIVNNNYAIDIGTSFSRTGFAQAGQDNVVDFLENIVTESKYNTPNGTINLITNNDIDIADMRREINKLSLRSFQANRKYIFSKKSGTLDKILKEEFKLLGVYPALTSDGKMTIRSLRNINPYETADFTIDADDILTDLDYPTIETNKFGIYNSVVVKIGYNANTQKFEGPSIVQNNIDSISIYGRSKQIEIAPISTSPYCTDFEIGLNIADFLDIMLRATGLLSKDYWVLSIDVPLKYFNANIGSIVRVKNKQLPNYEPNQTYLNSRRGSSRILGTVVGKTFSLEKGFGSLSILVSDKEFAAADVGIKAIYAPDALLSSVLNVGGDSWLLTFDTNYSSLFVPQGKVQSDFWNIGDRIRVDRWNSDSFVTGYGTINEIQGVGTNNLVLLVDFSAPGYSPTNFNNPNYQWIVKCGDYNQVGLTTDQARYCFIDSGVLSTPGNIPIPSNKSRVLSY